MYMTSPLGAQAEVCQATWFVWSSGHGLASLVVSTELPVGLEIEVERIVAGVIDRMLRGLDGAD